MSPSPVAGALNGSYVLNKTTASDDGTADVLTGGSGLNWYFAGRYDIVLNGKAPPVPAEHAIFLLRGFRCIRSLYENGDSVTLRRL